jgi:hypothetical protein
MTQAEKKAADKLAADNAQKELDAKKAELDAKTSGETKPDAKPEPVYESENLTKLRAQESDLTDKLFAAGKTPEGKKIMLELWTVGQSIENEIAAIKKAQAALEAETKRNAIIAGFWSIFDLYDAKKATDAKLAEIPVEARTEDNMAWKGLMATANDAKTALDNAAEPIINRLLGSVPAKTSGTTTATTAASSNGKGKTTQEIRDAIAPMYSQGKTGAEIRSHVIKTLGYNDGTANAVILAYEKENHLNGH